MPQGVAQALVLGSFPFREQDKIVFLLTLQRGIIKAVAPGAGKAKNRFGSLLELFSEGEFHYYWNEEKEMVTLSKGEIQRSFFPLVSRPEALFHFSLMAETVLKFLPPQQRNRRVYQLLLAILKGRQEGLEMNGLLLYFLIWLLQLEGLLFNLHACSNCQAKNLTQAWIRKDFRGLLCRSCRRDEALELGPAELDYLRVVLRQPPRQTATAAAGVDLPRLLRLFIQQIEYHGEFSLRSKQYVAACR